ncbi:MAG: AbrB/MazE/SpoVT family DNA-binding domain-containing protein [Anaerolineae bacterium]|nr:AbrB/MazE/SpoVT family DNA-binding domain-containing protein [Anaerolineae bacterium]
MYTVKVSTKGWVVIPRELRAKYGIESGSQVQVVDYGDVLALVPLPDDPVEALHGLLAGETSLTADLLAAHATERESEEVQRG